MDLEEHGLEHMLEELLGSAPVCLLDELGDGELTGPVDAHEEMELFFGGLHLGNVDVEEPDRGALELLPFGLVAVHFRQAGDALPLKTPVQRRARQVQDRRLQRIETVVQRRQRMTPERDDHLFLRFRQHR